MAKIPSNISFEEAASLPTGIAEAVVGLYSAKPNGAGFTIPLEPEERGKLAGKPLLILGGAGSVGQAVIQFARLFGFSPIFTTASFKNEEYLKSLGATQSWIGVSPPRHSLQRSPRSPVLLWK